VRKFLSTVLFICVGLPLALSSLLLIAARPWALDREAYRRFVRDDRLYAALRAPEIAARAPETIRLGTAVFAGPALVAAAQKDLPLPEIKSTASKAVDAMLDAVEGGTPASAAPVDMRPLKAAIRAKSAAMARDYSAALAERTAARPGLVQPAAVAEALTAAVDAMPDTAMAQAPAARAFERPGPRLGGIAARGLSQALLDRMTAAMAAVSALLLAALGALGGRSALSRVSRAGTYLLVPSLMVLAIGVALAIPGGLIFQNIFPRGFQGMAGGSAGTLLRAYLASVLGPIARSFFITGLVGASLGGVLSQARRMGEPKELE
jgi:hypothetical protein